MTRILFIIIFLAITLSLQAQKKAPFKAADLALRWELVQNQYDGKSQALAKLRIHNQGKKKVPAAGWALYFNSVRSYKDAYTRPAGWKVEELSGDWFRLTPTADFAGLAPGDSCELPLVSQHWLLNRADAPNGFYVVFDADPGQGYATKPVRIVPPANPDLLRRGPEDRAGRVTPAVVFAQNEATPRLPASALRPVFPTPVSLEMQPGHYALDGNIVICAVPSLEREARLLSEQWSTWFGKTAAVLILPAERHHSGISLRLSDKMRDPESYELRIHGSEGVRIEAGGAAGAFYGIQSLKTLLPAQAWSRPLPSAAVPCLTVSDAPRFAYRGMHVDVARNFQTAKEILRILDVMALYKLNKLHLHFSDDEGWRIEIAGLPELTQVGARRGHSADEREMLHPAYGSGPDPASGTGSGYYSRREFVEILKYATERHIEVIPEIELPGHARAAIKSMDARYERLRAEGRLDEAARYLLRDLEDRSKYLSVQSYNDNVVNVALPSTYAFVEKVCDELLAMYLEAGAPLGSIHLGGDEVPNGVWEQSPACRQLMQQQGMGSTDDLWYYFWKKMRDMLAQRGLQVAGWEEAGLRKTRLDGKLHYLPNPDFVNDRFRMYVWNNVLGWGAEDLAYRMANAGYEVVLGPVSNLYFDMAYHNDFDEPGYYWGAYTDVDKAFSFVPFDYFKTAAQDRFGNPIDPAIFVGKSRLTDYGKGKIVGIQGLIWSETLHGPHDLEFMVFPKLLGLAERAWSPAPAYETTADSVQWRSQYAEAWAHFANQLGQRELPRLDFYTGGIYYRIPTPGAVVRNGILHANIQLPGFAIRYTTDGSDPTINSPLYAAPMPVSGRVKLRAFDTRGRGSRVVMVE
ncbi:MAG: carbohydate-binding domain-containing protein [Saprospiraceae bacterium]|nr:carbohydate-binding domain-containing protein [Saprospiraceae bacterium]